MNKKDKNTQQSTFNKNTKNAVLSAKVVKKCCKRSHLLGQLLFGQSFSFNEIRLVSENEGIINHAIYLLNRIVGLDVADGKESFSDLYKLSIKDEKICEKVLSFYGYEKNQSAYTIPNEVFACDMCKNEFLKGVFLACGNISSPEKSYHLELNVADFNLLKELLSFLENMSLGAKYTKRASHYVIYYKESEKIVDFLGLIQATKESFEYYNTLIKKDLRNQINRLNNCETANLSKQISTATKQIEAINKLFSMGGKEALDDELLETAVLRVENPNASLKELAEMHKPQITKSCVNRRLKKLLEM